ncbi:hypothetical protein PR048_011539 [Dryococelus australis]|uniref:Uncharacterized protein n=1 Tax=Dryococelus australis TaxID=614101 RepID=A0ABQ9HLY8_9NEOP|nr:hypothetical protein PR048_011539 [Dryococelus australis]
MQTAKLNLNSYCKGRLHFYTSTTNDDYTSLAVRFVDSSFKPHHLCIEVVPFLEILHNAENISKFLTDILQAWNICHKVVVRDNARNIICALNSSNFDHLPCIAHTLQLVIKDGLRNTPSIKNMVTNCKHIVGHAKHSSQVCKIVRIVQKKLNLPEHKLVQDEPTR